MTLTLQQLIIPGMREEESFIEELFITHRTMIESLAYRYWSYRLDPAYEKDDYIQMAYFAVSVAARKWQFHRGDARFGSMLFHYIRKEFQSKVTGIHKLVEITNRAGVVTDILTYSVYQKKRKQLEAEGLSGTPYDRLVSLNEYHQPHDFPDIDAYTLHSDETIAIGS